MIVTDLFELEEGQAFPSDTVTSIVKVLVSSSGTFTLNVTEPDDLSFKYTVSDSPEESLINALPDDVKGSYVETVTFISAKPEDSVNSGALTMRFLRRL